MDNFANKKRKEEEEQGVSIYSRSVSLLDADPLDEIFALNLGDFMTEHLINPELANKISSKIHKTRDKNESLKSQLNELVSIYSINNTLQLLGFKDEDEYVIYNSVAKTIALMLSLKECNIYLAKRGEPIKLNGTSRLDDLKKPVPEYITECWKNEETAQIQDDCLQIFVFPMKNNFECIGAIEITRPLEKPLEKEFRDLIEITSGLFVTSLGLQKLIDEVKRTTGPETVSTSELQNLRAQLTAIIGDLGEQQQAFVEILAVAVDKKSAHEADHSRRTAELSRGLCAHLGLNEKTTDLIYYAGLLRNIGQITLPEELFNKKTSLTKEEWDKLQDSPNAGVSLLMNINFLSEVVPYIHYHKERWDGKGVPEGLGGFSIPFGSRIIALADAYCALLEERPHRKALGKDEALKVVQKESGIKWDPMVVEALVNIV